MTRLTRRTALNLMGSAALPMPFIRPARAEGATLTLYNWADFLGETTIAVFEAETGISVNYDTFNSRRVRGQVAGGRHGLRCGRGGRIERSLSGEGGPLCPAGPGATAVLGQS